MSCKQYFVLFKTHPFTYSSLNPTLLKSIPTHILMLDLKFEFASIWIFSSIFSLVLVFKKHQVVSIFQISISIFYFSRCWTPYLHLSFLLWQVRNFTSDYWMERLRGVMVVSFVGKLVTDLPYILILLFIIHAIIHSFVAA